MDFSSAIYAYQFSNASASSVDALGYAFIAFFLIAAAASIALGPYVYGFFVYKRKESEKLEKKRTIQNLLVMKDIQTELEEEMKRALTNANLTQ